MSASDQSGMWTLDQVSRSRWIWTRCSAAAPGWFLRRAPITRPRPAPRGPSGRPVWRSQVGPVSCHSFESPFFDTWSASEPVTPMAVAFVACITNSSSWWRLLRTPVSYLATSCRP